MVAYKDVLEANALINDGNAPQVAVFAGGTSGLGKLTIKALVSTGVSVRIYLVGRKSAEEPMKAFINELRAINSKADVVWTEGDISLLQDTKRICEIIKSKESRVDLLFLSAGYAPFKGRELTSEGLEVTQVLEYYSRMLFILQLLPLLKKSESSKVISILAGGMERSSMDVEDLNLEKPGNFGGAKAQGHFAHMNTVFMDRLASEHKDVTFIHSWPAWVNTGNAARSTDPNTLAGWLFWLVVEPLVWLIGMKEEVAAQRYLFLSTSSAFGGSGVPWSGKAGVNTSEQTGKGMFLVSAWNNASSNAKNIAALREQAQQKVWDKTQEVLRPYL